MMGIFDLSPIEYQKFLFVLLRVGALIMFIPILGSAQVSWSYQDWIYSFCFDCSVSYGSQHADA